MCYLPEGSVVKFNYVELMNYVTYSDLFTFVLVIIALLTTLRSVAPFLIFTLARLKIIVKRFCSRGYIMFHLVLYLHL